jgi:acetyltransferase
VQGWRAAGVNTVVSLLTPDEVIELQLQKEESLCRDEGIGFRSLPIPDRGVPPSLEQLAELVGAVKLAVESGESVVVHCRQGIGRSALVVASVMAAFGEEPAAAFEKIGAARGCPVPDTTEQKDWVRDAGPDLVLAARERPAPYGGSPAGAWLISEVPMLDMFFRPASIAIIGASAKPLTIGYRIMKNIMDFGFGGPIHPVTPSTPEILGKTTVKNITEVPGPVDLAHIVIKNTMVPDALRDCAKKGVKGVIVNTSGFSEIGTEGQKLEDELKRLGKELGLRIFGPNCQGVMNTDPGVRLYSNFTFARIKPGHISILAQGGGVAEVIDNYISEVGVGIRMYASNGNACDVSIPEILAYWDEDPETRVIVLHVESFRDPKAFLDAVSKIKKPILAMKSGTSEAGARAVASHTGLLMKDDTITDLVFERCRILRFAKAQDLCEAAIAFARAPIPKGRRVGIVTNAGSPAILATDEGIAAGLDLSDPAPETQEHLKKNLFATSSVHNPVDMMATAGPKEWAVSTEALLKDDRFDMVLLSFITPFFVDCEGVAREIARLKAETAKPLIACVMTNTEWKGTLDILDKAEIPVYYFPESAARAAAALADYAALRDRPAGTVPWFPIDRQSASALLASAAAAAGTCDGWLSGADCENLLMCYGIPHARSSWTDSVEAAVKAAREIGFPVVLKSEAAGVVHKSEAGAVAVGIVDEDRLRAEAGRMLSSFAGKFPKLQVQEMLSGGVEIIAGVTAIPGLGHSVMFGLGGVFVEVMKDVRFALAPMSDEDAKRTVRGIKGSRVLEGVRGGPPADIAAVEGILLRLSALVTDNPAIKELDLNPVMVFAEGKGAKVADVRVRI